MRPAGAVMIALALVGCTPSGRVAGGPKAGSEGQRLPSVATSPSLEIRIPDSVGGASAQMGRIVRLASGRFAIADWDGQRVLLFDSGGQLSRVFGRAGSGPGEFRAPSLIQEVAPDTLLLWDPFLRRITWLDTRSGGIGQLEVGTDKLYGGAPLVGQLSDGRLLVAHEAWTAQQPGAPSHPSITLRLLNSDGTPAVDLVTDLLVRNQDAHGFRFYGPTTLAATDGHRILVGTNTNWTIHLLSADGHTQASLTRPWHSRAVTEADRAAVRAGAKGAGAPAGVPSDDRFDATVPAFGRILTSSDGTIWVLSFTPPFQYTDSVSVFSAEGQFLGALALPKDFHPTDIGPAYILGTAQSPDGDFVARLFAVTWPPGGRTSH